MGGCGDDHGAGACMCQIGCCMMQASWHQHDVKQPAFSHSHRDSTTGTAPQGQHHRDSTTGTAPQGQYHRDSTTGTAPQGQYHRHHIGYLCRSHHTNITSTHADMDSPHVASHLKLRDSVVVLLLLPCQLLFMSLAGLKQLSLEPLQLLLELADVLCWWSIISTCAQTQHVSAKNAADA
jgi:hypothetical protein